MTPEDVTSFFEFGEMFVEQTIAAALVVLWIVVVLWRGSRPQARGVIAVIGALGIHVVHSLFDAAKEVLDLRPVPCSKGSAQGTCSRGPLKRRSQKDLLKLVAGLNR